ncbi:MAG: hypothetical protein KJ607_14200 [Bacteroidetes bacterium]|nr:hypothetical protein [Bacteroidota bacterium]
MKALLIGFIVFSCFLMAGKKQDVEVISATSRKWQGGRPGSSRSINYTFVLKVYRSSEKLTIDQLWVGDRQLAIKQQYFPGKDSLQFEKNDTVRFVAGEILVLPDFETGTDTSITVIIKSLPPVSYEGAALIGYLSGKKRRYLVIDHFKTLKPVNAP